MITRARTIVYWTGLLGLLVTTLACFVYVPITNWFRLDFSNTSVVVCSDESCPVASPANGVFSRHEGVIDGQTVVEGQTLGRISSLDLNNAVAIESSQIVSLSEQMLRLELQLIEVDTPERRNDILKEIRAANEGLLQAQLRHDQLKTQLNLCQLVAPVSGWVTRSGSCQHITVSRDQVVLEIVPRESQLFLEIETESANATALERRETFDISLYTSEGQKKYTVTRSNVGQKTRQVPDTTGGLQLRTSFSAFPYGMTLAGARPGDQGEISDGTDFVNQFDSSTSRQTVTPVVMHVQDVQQTAANDKDSELLQDLTVVGMSFPPKHKRLRAAQSGLICDLNVSCGDTVDKDQIVAELDTVQFREEMQVHQNTRRSFETKIRIAELHSRNCLAKYERAQKLRNSQAIAEESLENERVVYEQAQLVVQSLEADRDAETDRIEQLEAIIAQHQVRSPIRGVVSRLIHGENEFVTAGEELVEVTSPDQCILIYLPGSCQPGTRRYLAATNGQRLPCVDYWQSPTGNYVVQLQGDPVLPCTAVSVKVMDDGLVTR